MKNYLALILCLLGSFLWAQKVINLNEESYTSSVQSSRQNIPVEYLKNAKASRVFAINKALQSKQSTKVGDVVTLQLFEGKSYNAKVSNITTDVNGVFVITAKLTDYPLGYAIITTDGISNKSSIMLEVPELNEYYTSVGNINSQTNYLIEVDKGRFNESSIENDVLIPDSAAEEKQNDVTASLKTQANSIAVASKGVNDHANIDIMIVYTPQTETWANSDYNGINNYISTLIAYANNVLNNSLVYATITLVHSEKVNYTSVGGGLDIDLSRLRNTNDGYLDEIHTLRDQYAADLVTLIQKEHPLETGTGSACGKGYLLNSSTGKATDGFNVIKTIGDYCYPNTFAHEIGHNMGMEHDVNNATNTPIFPYAYGWKWTANGQKYGSVMSYYTTNVPYYSNPVVFYEGQPTGDADASTANNALVFKNTKHYVAAYREKSMALTNLLVSDITNNGAVLKWDAVSGATGYIIEYKISTATNYTSVIVTTNTKALTGLVANTIYDWKVTTIGGNSITTQGSEFVTQMSTPVLSVSNITATGAKLDWTAVNEAEYYLEYKTAAANYTNSSLIGSSTKSLTGLIVNTTYNWRVRILTHTGVSTTTEGPSFTTATYGPMGLTVSNIKSNEAILSWGAVNGATSYKVEYKTSTETNYTAVTVTTNTIEVTNLEAKKTYNWRVTAINSAGSTSSISNGANFVTLAPVTPTSPTNLTVSNITSNEATLNWTAVSGATSYKAEYKTSSATTYSSVTVTAATRVLTGLTANTSYNWRVTAINSVGSSVATEGTSFTTLPAAPKAPTGLAVNNITVSGAILNWTAVSGATSYKVEYKTSAATTYSSVTVTTNAKALTGLTAGTVYNWRVTAINAGGSSAATTGTNFTTLVAPPVAPTDLTISNITTTGVTLKWAAVSGATSYKVEYKTVSATDYTSVIVTTNTKALTGLNDNKAYNWRVTAINTGGSSAATTGTDFWKMVQAPTGLEVNAIGTTGVNLKWNSVNDAYAYKIEYKTLSETAYSSVTMSTNASSSICDISIKSLIPNTAYTWRVSVITVFNSGGSGIEPSAATVGTNFTTLSCNTTPKLKATVEADTSLRAYLSMDGPVGQSYKLELKEASATTWKLITDNWVWPGGSGVFQLNSTQIALNKTYNWRVTYVCSSGDIIVNGPNFTTISGLSSSKITTSLNGKMEKTTLTPNPVHDLLYIRGLGNNGERAAVIIYNMSGQIVKTMNVTLEDSIKIDVSDLPENNYILTIKGNQFNFIKI